MIYMRFPEGRKKVFTLSFDDGVGPDIRFIRLLEEFSLKGTFNINSGLFAPEETVFEEGLEKGRITKSMANSLYRSPAAEVALHGVYHILMDQASLPEMVREIADDRRSLEAMFETAVRGMAFAYGAYNEDVLRVAHDCGVVYARTVNSTERFDMPQNFLTWHPTCHQGNSRLFALADAFLKQSVPRSPALFYVWGHTYELDNDNSWDRMREFFETMAGKDDIWYATNGDIYDYTAAFRSLIWTFDQTMVTNPTVRPVYVYDDRNHQDYCLSPGETRVL